MLPQVVENYKQGRVKGLSHLLVFLNNIGDIMKLAYFFLNVTYSTMLGSAKTIHNLWVRPSESGYHSDRADSVLRMQKQGLT
jgi:hypothetical protein